MAKKRKFRKGALVPDMNALSLLIQSGYWIYWLERPKHPSVIESMTFRTLLYALNRGILRVAISNA